MARLVRFRLSQLNYRGIHCGEHFTHGSLKEIELQYSVPLAGRKYLPSSDTAGLPKYLSGPRENYPLLIKAVNGQAASLEHWAKRCKEIINQAYSKYEQDRSPVAILFRGLPVTDEKDLACWLNGLGYEPFAYFGGTGPRKEIAENVAEGALDDKKFTIDPHNEMTYSDPYPKILVMGNFKTASWGGETALCDSREVHSKLDPNFVAKCEEKEIRYWNFVRDKNSPQKDLIYKSWQMQFATEDSQKVEEYLKEFGYTYGWEDGSLFYWKNFPAFINHAISGERLWFNQVAASHCSYHLSSPFFEGVKLPNKYYPFHTMYGDGEEIDPSLIDEHRRVTWESSVGFQWRNGDVLFVDQLIVQHSRLGFEGERKVGVSLLTYS